MSAASRQRWKSVILAVAWIRLALPGAAAELERGSGPHFYALVNRETGLIEQRGEAGSAGVAFDRLILAASRSYRIWLLQATTLRTGFIDIVSAANGRTLALPPILLGTDLSPDVDGDGLGADGELILGTTVTVADTDGDGISDGAEVRLGNDPLSGRAVRTGIVGTADTPGVAEDVWAIDDLAIVADRTRGVAVFNVFGGMNPVLIAQVDTPGDARSVSSSGAWVVVADGAAGLAVIDISDPPAASIRHQMNVGGSVRTVVAAGPVAYAGTDRGEVVLVDLATGTVLDRLDLGGAIQDVALGGDYLYALEVGRLHVLPLDEAGLQVATRVEAPGGLGAGGRRLRVFAGGGVAYTTFLSGYHVLDIRLPEAAGLLRTIDTSQFGWKQIVGNGSGLGLAAVSPNSTDDGPHHISLYRVGEDGAGHEFVTTLETPGLASALAIYDGRAFVADSAAGLQVLNYLAFDSAGKPPTIELESNFGDGRAEEAKLMRVTARVRDDVQVRNVEFHVDGVRVATDGNHPFEHRFLTPRRSDARPRFTVRARASDTGGNAAWSEERVFELVPDGRPPRVRRTIPFAGALVGSIGSLTAFFSEPIAAASVNASTVRLLAAGADGVFGTSDDAEVPGAVEYREGLVAALFVPDTRISPGNYRFSIRPPVADLAGNPIAAEVTSAFRVFAFTDEDGDGMPDELERALGLDPTRLDTDGDGIPDGLEDFDSDRLPNAGEVFAETDPTKRDTDGNGILDGDEDPDGDALNNAREFAVGTSPRVADTDGDGWNDEAEVTARSDPTNPASRPRLVAIARPPIQLLRIALEGGASGTFGPGTFVARPPVSALLPAIQTAGVGGPGTYVARPPVVVISSGFGADAAVRGVVLGRPPVVVRIEP